PANHGIARLNAPRRRTHFRPPNHRTTRPTKHSPLQRCRMLAVNGPVAATVKSLATARLEGGRAVWKRIKRIE
ncbi:MAG: hypothetical protein ACREX9_11730, partial [Gammaproteobacteria bacterium]